MKRCDGKIGVYLLFLALGVGLGALFGGQFMEHLFSGTLSDLFFRGKTTYSASESDKENQICDKKHPCQYPNLPDDITLTRQNAIVTATNRVAPCVVGIVVTQIQVVRKPYYSDDFFDFFFGPDFRPRYRQVESIGSGFVISEDGKILTNYHVVQNASKLYVNFSDGRRIEGKIIGYDEQSDLAVLTVKGNDFQCVRFGNSNDALIGEWAIAIGNPFLNFINDVHPTVTVGVISALNRNFAPSEGVYYQGMIQTDAAINPGNSGGPLVNALGEVIGINTFIYTGSKSVKGSIGIGFAIPIDRARKVAEELITYGKRRQIWTGISVQDLNLSIAQSLGYDNSDGVVVVSIQKGSPGEQAGLAAGDVIKQMGNRYIQTHSDLEGFFIDYFVGDKVKMNIIRKGKPLEITMVLSEFPS